MNFCEYRVEYKRDFGDNQKWEARSDTHATMEKAIDELARIRDLHGYCFRIVKRTVTAWEVVE